MKFPDWNVSEYDWRIPMLDLKLSIHYPGWMFSTIFYLGIGTATYFIGKAVRCLTSRVQTYFKALQNGAKYLSPKSEENGKTYSAVIYGAGTKVGRAYAHYLSNRGFNLILVERDNRSLDALQVNLQSDLLTEPVITKIVLDRFDQDTFNKNVVAKLKAHEDSPVKIFVNCKNSRRKLTTEAQATQH
jgi:hypothetical protein